MFLKFQSKYNHAYSELHSTAQSLMEITEPTQCDSHPGAIKTFENRYTQDQQTLKSRDLIKIHLAQMAFIISN